MLNALSKKLTLSPRPHRRLQRQKKAITIHGGDLIAPDFTPENSPTLARQLQHKEKSHTMFSQSFDCHHSNVTHSFEAADIMVIVDDADMDNSDHTDGKSNCTDKALHHPLMTKSVQDEKLRSPLLRKKQQFTARQTHSDPINPKLLNVHWMNTIDIDPDDGAGTGDSESRCSSVSELDFINATSLPSSPVSSPVIPRRRGSWGKGIDKLKRNPKLAHKSHSFAGLLRSKKLHERRFSLDADMINPEQTYWVITVGIIREETDFEVSTLTESLIEYNVGKKTAFLPPTLTLSFGSHSGRQ